MTPIFLPGWSLGRRPLEAIANACRGQILDLPGYGRTPLNTDFFQAADQLAEGLPDQCPLIGWSLGAQLALAIAARHPGKVGKLVLIAGTPSFIQREGWPHAVPEAVLQGFSEGVHQDFAATLPRFVGSFNRGDTRARMVTRTLLDGFAQDTPPALPTLLAGLNWLRDVDLRPELERIHTPTLMLHGAVDPLMPVAGARQCADRMPDARLEILEGCAHAPFLSAPPDFLAHLACFLDG